MAIYEVELPIENARKQKEQEETHKECIECFRMFEKPDDDADVCRFCQDSGREGRMR